MAEAEETVQTSASIIGGTFEIVVSSGYGEVLLEVFKVVRTASEVAREGCEVAREVCKAVKSIGKEIGPDVKKGLGIGLGVGLGLGLSLGALYSSYKVLQPVIKRAITKGCGGERDDQEVRDIRPGSLHVVLHCSTDERFLEVLVDYESGRMKERLQEELSQVGIQVEGLKVKIENMEMVNETKKSINKRYMMYFLSLQMLE